MSPEQCTSSKVDHRSDIYSLGVVIYETLTGEVPFMSDELVKVMAMHLSDTPKLLNQVRGDLRFPDRLEQVVHKALAKNPDNRFQNMEEFAEALEECLKEPEKPAYVPPNNTVPPSGQSGHTTVHPTANPAHAGPMAGAENLGQRRESREFSMPKGYGKSIGGHHPAFDVNPIRGQSDPTQSGAYRPTLWPRFVQRKAFQCRVRAAQVLDTDKREGPAGANFLC